MSELSLVIFTVLAQAVAGGFITLAIYVLTRTKNKGHPPERSSLPTLTVLMALLIIAGVTALTHLGSPLRAFNVLFGLAHQSAMSLEILSVTLFGVILAAVAIAEWKGLRTPIKSSLYGLGILAAILQLLAIANVYYLPTEPFWNTIWTPVNFLMTAVITGPVLLLLLSSLFKSHHQIQQVFPVPMIAILLSAVALSGGYLLNLMDLFAQFEQAPPDWMSLQVIRITAIVFGYLMCLMKLPRALPVPFAMTALILVFIAELSGRIAFYDLGLINSL